MIFQLLRDLIGYILKLYNFTCTHYSYPLFDVVEFTIYRFFLFNSNIHYISFSILSCELDAYFEFVIYRGAYHLALDHFSLRHIAMCI